MYLVFDIETAPLPPDRLEVLADAAQIKADSRLKDEAKIEKSIAEKRQAFIDGAALSAGTSTVLAIGSWRSDTGQVRLSIGEDEKMLLTDFWNDIEHLTAKNGYVVGFNSNSFDIPFLIRRAMIHGIVVPPIFTGSGYLSHRFVDLRERWTMPKQYGMSEKSSLRYLAEVFQLPVTKMEGADGSQFWQMWKFEPEKATEYLRLDVVTTVRLGQRMGVIK